MPFDLGSFVSAGADGIVFVSAGFHTEVSLKLNGTVAVTCRSAFKQWRNALGCLLPKKRLNGLHGLIRNCLRNFRLRLCALNTFGTFRSIPRLMMQTLMVSKTRKKRMRIRLRQVAVTLHSSWTPMKRPRPLVAQRLLIANLQMLSTHTSVSPRLKGCCHAKSIHHGPQTTLTS